MSQEVRACGRAQLSRFLVREGMGEPEAAVTLERLEPFFSAAEGGRYSLSSVGSMHDGAIANAIALAVGDPVITLRPISVGGLAALPGRGSRAHALRASGANLRRGVWLALVLGRSAALRASLGDERRLALGDAVGSSFGWRLRASFDTTFVRVLGDDFALHAWNSVEETLVHHLGCAIAGDSAGAASLLPLITVLPAAVPLCPASDDSRAWVVLVR